MTLEISEEIKKEIFRLISIPGVQIEEIAEKTQLNSKTVLKILSEEYLRCNLDYGRRLCCRF